MQSTAQRMSLNLNLCQSQTLCLSLNQPTRPAQPQGKASRRRTLSFASKEPDLMRKLFSSGFVPSGDLPRRKPTKKTKCHHFRSECPNGKLSRSHLLQLFTKVFPQGNADSFCEHIFRSASPLFASWDKFQRTLTLIKTSFVRSKAV